MRPSIHAVGAKDQVPACPLEEPPPGPDRRKPNGRRCGSDGRGTAGPRYADRPPRSVRPVQPGPSAAILRPGTRSHHIAEFRQTPTPDSPTMSAPEMSVGPFRARHGQTRLQVALCLTERTWRSTRCSRMRRKAPCAESSREPDGTMHISPAFWPYSEVRLPWTGRDPFRARAILLQLDRVWMQSVSESTARIKRPAQCPERIL